MTRKEILQIAKPILFNTEMVRAILDGRKTVTRRLIKPQPVANRLVIRPYNADDYLYVRESWCRLTDWEDQYPDDDNDMLAIYYRADYHKDMAETARWRPSIHMPKEAARIFLRITDMYAERLQDITDKQVVAEGCNIPITASDEERCLLAFARFPKLWDSTIKKSELDKYDWKANPWVWVIEFERID